MRAAWNVPSRKRPCRPQPPPIDHSLFSRIDEQAFLILVISPLDCQMAGAAIRREEACAMRGVERACNASGLGRCDRPSLICASDPPSFFGQPAKCEVAHTLPMAVGTRTVGARRGFHGAKIKTKTS
jgi:hypothetical protein